jgi:hypothetical protein
MMPIVTALGWLFVASMLLGLLAIVWLPPLGLDRAERREFWRQLGRWSRRKDGAP